MRHAAVSRTTRPTWMETSRARRMYSLFCGEYSVFITRSSRECRLDAVQVSSVAVLRFARNFGDH